MPADRLLWIFIRFDRSPRQPIDCHVWRCVRGIYFVLRTRVRFSYVNSTLFLTSIDRPISWHSQTRRTIIFDFALPREISSQTLSRCAETFAARTSFARTAGPLVNRWRKVARFAKRLERPCPSSDRGIKEIGPLEPGNRSTGWFRLPWLDRSLDNGQMIVACRWFQGRVFWLERSTYRRFRSFSLYLFSHPCHTASWVSASQFRLICLPNPPAYKYTATPSVNRVSRSSVITSPTTLRPCTDVSLSPFFKLRSIFIVPVAVFGRAFIKFPFVALNLRVFFSRFALPASFLFSRQFRSDKDINRVDRWS